MSTDKATIVHHEYRINVVNNKGHLYIPNNLVRGTTEREARELAIKRANEILKTCQQVQSSKNTSKVFKMFLDYQKTVIEVSKYKLNNITGEFEA